MDKKVFLLNKDYYSEKTAKKLTENQLEHIVSKDSYLENSSIIKIDANGYDTPQEAIDEEDIYSVENYYIRSFGF